MKYYPAIFLNGQLLQSKAFDNYEEAFKILDERNFVKTGEEIGFHGLFENFVSTASPQFTGSISHEEDGPNEGEKGSHHCSDECWMDDSED